VPLSRARPSSLLGAHDPEGRAALAPRRRHLSRSSSGVLIARWGERVASPQAAVLPPAEPHSGGRTNRRRRRGGPLPTQMLNKSLSAYAVRRSNEAPRRALRVTNGPVELGQRAAG
jgi:hypothetical protein